MIHIPFSRSVKQFVVEREFEKFKAKSGWSFSDERWRLIRLEWSDWVKNYLPFDLSGKTVLDVGAGEGETAKLFIDAGASEVVCIEPNEFRFRYLLRNAESFPITAVKRKFFVSDLFVERYDLIKIDIEGYEAVLLRYDLPKPIVLEIHGLQLVDAFREKGFRIGKHTDIDDFWTCYGFFGC